MRRRCSPDLGTDAGASSTNQRKHGEGRSQFGSPRGDAGDIWEGALGVQGQGSARATVGLVAWSFFQDSRERKGKGNPGCQHADHPGARSH